ncbi:MAG: hypothetical protein FE044_02945 [Thermoplasmata archaeon]|nr:MAG: hypothetical protein FE044_02945 [Thermoplasmata archaeon]
MGDKGDIESEVERIKDFIKEHPEFRKILRLAVEHERKGEGKEYYIGWEWSDVRCHPAKLVKCITNDICTISYKSNRYTCYKLLNRKAVEIALGMKEVN